MPKEQAPPPTGGAAGGEARVALPRQTQVFFFIILGLLLFVTWGLFRDLLIYLVAGVFVAVIALPIDRFWERFFPNRVSAFCTIFTLAVLFAVPLMVGGIALYSDARELATDIEEGKAEEWLNQTLAVVWPSQTQEQRNETVQKFLDVAEHQVRAQLDGLAARLVQSVITFFIAVTVILFVVYYVLTDGDKLVAYLKRATPLPPRQIEHLLAEAHRGLQGVFRGQILTSLIQGAVGSMGFFIAGVPGAVFWGLVMAIFSLLPVLGPFMVWAPAAGWLAINGHLSMAIFLTIWGLVVVSLVDNVVRPKLIGDRTNIHPLFVLIGVVGGVAAFGFIGLFLGPLIVGVTLSVLKIWEADYLDPSIRGRDAP